VALLLLLPRLEKNQAIAPFDYLNQLPLWNLLGFIKSYDSSFYGENGGL
jgi:hypothetical protein